MLLMWLSHAMLAGLRRALIAADSICLRGLSHADDPAALLQ